MSLPIERLDTDVLVIGTGIAGLTFTLRVAERFDVILVTKKARVESNTNYAQGGIAAVFGDDDSFASHAGDTLSAGAGLCHKERVAELVRAGPKVVRDLIEWGVNFTHADGGLALGMEGGHSKRRIVHSRDLTGPAIESALVEAVGLHPRIRVFEDHMALGLRVAQVGGLMRCVGAWALDARDGGLLEVQAANTLLASGGGAAIYKHTTNPAIATGDGIAMAYRAGATVANLEFVQFHPTAFYPAEEHAFLITEALRGAGAVLKNERGEAFMERYDPRRDLAPRDVVARAVHAELLKNDASNAWLDATDIATEVLEEEFPNIMKRCAERGIDLHRNPIPIVPAAHYMCGGVWTDIDGRSTLPGLYSAGECSCSGVHGANRLASNSLLEAVVFAERASRHIGRGDDRLPADIEVGDPPSDLSRLDVSAVNTIRDELKLLMWERMGIVRAHSRIREGASQLAELRQRWASLLTDSPGQREKQPSTWERGTETGFMLDLAWLMMRCALWRRESRGLHFDTQHPYKDNECFLKDTLIVSS